MANQQVTGPTTLQILSGDSSVQAQYFAAKLPAVWSVSVLSDGTLSPADYTVAISSSGLLTVTLAPGVTVPDPGTSFLLSVHASSGSGNGNNDTLLVTVDVDSTVVPCFVAGTRIATPDGPRAVEALEPGDSVLTASGRAVPIRWVGQRSISRAGLERSPALCPVLIPKDSIAPGQPERDLYVSPLHRIRIGGWRAELVKGAPFVFVHAFSLPFVRRALPRRGGGSVCYYHILCDGHEVILSNGLATETLYPGDIALKGFGTAAVEEMRASVPRLREQGLAAVAAQTALPCARRFEAALIFPPAA